MCVLTVRAQTACKGPLPVKLLDLMQGRFFSRLTTED
jgi:hypothetical protein